MDLAPTTDHAPRWSGQSRGAGGRAVGAAAWQHAQDHELTRVGVATKPDARVANSHAVLVQADGLADIYPRIG
jgi:hypothetical protein